MILKFKSVFFPHTIDNICSRLCLYLQWRSSVASDWDVCGLLFITADPVLQYKQTKRVMKKLYEQSQKRNHCWHWRNHGKVKVPSPFQQLNLFFGSDLRKEWSWGKKWLLLNEGTFNLSWDAAAAARWQQGEGVSTWLIFISAEVLDYREGSDARPLAAC